MAKGDGAANRLAAARTRQWAVAAAVLLVAAAAATALAVSRGGTPPRRSGTNNAHTSTSRSLPLTFISATPPGSTAKVVFQPKISLTFNTAIAPHSPLPSIWPPIPGTWSHPAPKTVVFQPSGQLLPLERVTVTAPGGPGGMLAVDRSRLSHRVSLHFTVEGAPVLRLQQLLAELGYLPLDFQPTSLAATTSSGRQEAPRSDETSAATALAAEPTNPAAIPLAPSPGRFTWRYPRIPAQLSSLWTTGTWNMVTQGAVMAFEADHGLAINGAQSSQLWGALLDAVARRAATTRPYSYVLITETDPETLYVWSAGRVVYHSLTNTGISVAPTDLGTWPVYLRFTSVTMSGTNPDGSHYSDPGVPWVSYFHGGDAVHGFWRSSWGFPQSLGCVELPIQNAAIVYPYDTYGTLVTVTTGELAGELSAPASD